MRLALGILIGILIFLGFVMVTRTSAQIPDGAHWQDPCISHSGDEPLDTWAGFALTEWGVTSSISDCGAGTDIVITWVPTLHGTVLGQARVATLHDNTIAWCEIRISEVLTEDIPDENLYIIIAHEVGHCLGLNHVFVLPSIMYPNCCHWWAQIDRDNIATKYPQAGPVPTATVATPVPATPTVTVIDHPPPITPTPGVHGQPFFSAWTFPDLEIPDDYGFAAVYEYRDGEWSRWASGVPDYVNSLLTLERGEHYWFVPWK